MAAVWEQRVPLMATRGEANRGSDASLRALLLQSRTGRPLAVHTQSFVSASMPRRSRSRRFRHARKSPLLTRHVGCAIYMMRCGQRGELYQ